MSGLRVPEKIRSMGIFQFVTRSPARIVVTMAMMILIYMFFFSPLLNSSMPVAISFVVFFIIFCIGFLLVLELRRKLGL
ncbi:hypothetical protein [Pseudovibrio ascidiaceicola]|uniref:hypothetical protein n=1 Tax=Pseudovibrio ascidiaceicola TaxID=285279 RepID=UPI001AD9371D|nr:hypothetical protein [Pseudovibrio ascidiaceicola]